MQAKLYGRKLCLMSVISGALSGFIMLAAIPVILRISKLSPESLHYLKWMLVMCSYYMIGKSINSTTIAAFVLNMPVLVVYFIVNLDEIIKLPAVYKHYKKYKWIKDLTIKEAY